MALKNVKRVTYSLPIVSILAFEMNVEKNKRSKAIAELINEKYLKKEKNSLVEEVTMKDINDFWADIAKHYKPKVRKSAVEMQREDRLSH